MRAPNLSLEGDGSLVDHYEAAIRQLRDGLRQARSMARGEGQPGCEICFDNDHTAENCWYHNPLLLAMLGHDAIIGSFWRCFHCGAIYVNEAAAERHFGKTPDTPAECLKQLAALDAGE